MTLLKESDPTEPGKPRFGLRELLCEQSRDLYDAALGFEGELAELRDAVVSPSLSDLVEEMSTLYREAAEQLTEVCALLGVSPEGVACEAMKGLVRECKDSASDWSDSATRDAAIIAVSQRVAHYAIAGYGTGAAYARCLKMPVVEKTFRHLLQRTITLDALLSKLAVGGWFSPGINEEAAIPPSSPSKDFSR